MKTILFPHIQRQLNGSKGWVNSQYIFRTRHLDHTYVAGKRMIIIYHVDRVCYTIASQRVGYAIIASRVYRMFSGGAAIVPKIVAAARRSWYHKMVVFICCA